MLKDIFIVAIIDYYKTRVILKITFWLNSLNWIMKIYNTTLHINYYQKINFSDNHHNTEKLLIYSE